MIIIANYSIEKLALLLILWQQLNHWYPARFYLTLNV
jgi:hypothetical protein